MATDYYGIAEQCVKLSGGKDNITYVAHCMTRLRFRLKDDSLYQREEIDKIDSLFGTAEMNGEHQIIVGPGAVNKVYDAVLSITGQEGQGSVDDPEAEKADTQRTEKKEITGPKKLKGVGGKILDVISSVFIPIIPLVAAAGTLKGFLSIFVQLGLLTSTDTTYVILYAVADAVFYFLPIVIGYTAGKRFGANPFYTMILGAFLVYPTIVSAYSDGTDVTFLGIPVVMVSYTSSVLPIIFASWIAAKLQKFFEKVLPVVTQLIFVPFLTLVISAPLTLIIVGPVLTWVNDGLCAGVNALYEFAPLLCGAVMGGVWQAAVLSGIGWGFISVFLAQIATNGGSQLLACLACTVFAQGGAALAAGLGAKSKKFRSLGISAGITALLGVTEPSIYGINVPARKPFFIGLAAGAVGGLITAIFGTSQYALGPSGIFVIPVLIGSNGIDMAVIGGIIACIVSYVLAFVLTWLFGRKNTILDKSDSELAAAE
ncbi:MAG: PTS transporter subunit EIIC [Atopobiaceae bacterium]|jgi:PTS system beta-glucosides-specific IIC component|nr:PTS transporter subunit EIIC [Atopobiaceae bacterium]MCH4181251.1 PTS transporter subunit EIIC [Atopobiaceae bacterium]MCH4214780.1 PTS transporter subunit EIIC [Atopobiaceae bacterium]MCH4276832.1 PTS transporter subunit EIIC [Atopobiaceae bacterium]MCI1226177.1 PTS transporter subunit EIIC [Atopobiaceae bacterium]